MNKSEIAEKAAREFLEWTEKSGVQDNFPTLKEFIERAIAESQAWISVEEKLPTENERVLWWKVGEHEVDSVHLAEHPEDYFTHWMPLPEPPKGDQKS